MIFSSKKLALALFFAVGAIAMIYAISGVEAKDNSESKINFYVFEKLQESERVPVTIYLRDGISQNRFDSISNGIGSDGPAVEKFYPEAFVAELSEKEIRDLARNKYVKYIEYSPKIYPVLQESVQITGAAQTWPLQPFGQGLSGKGQTVCIVDTGVDLSHPDLAGKNLFEHNLDCYNSATCAQNASALDIVGHGTRVAGIIAASGGITGISPGANIISLKVTNGNGITISTNAIKRAVEWCTQHADEYNISAISISLASSGANVYSSSCDLTFPILSTAVNAAFAENLAVVAASGNDGNSNAISYPSCLDKAISVGATYKDDILWEDSNYNSLVKLFAPGVNITSTAMSGGYNLGDGTSYSAPMVSGAIAIMNQLSTLNGDGRMNPAEAENILFAQGEIVRGNPNPAVSGTRINIKKAIDSMLGQMGPVFVSTSTHICPIGGC